MNNFVLLGVVIIIAILIVAAAIGIAKLIAPRSYNPFLFAWAVVVQDLGIYGLLSVLFFLLILVLGLAYAWRKGALEWK